MFLHGFPTKYTNAYSQLLYIHCYLSNTVVTHRGVTLQVFLPKTLAFALYFQFDDKPFFLPRFINI